MRVKHDKFSKYEHFHYIKNVSSYDGDKCMRISRKPTSGHTFDKHCRIWLSESWLIDLAFPECNSGTWLSNLFGKNENKILKHKNILSNSLYKRYK